MFKYINKFKCQGIMLGSVIPLAVGNDFDKVEIGEDPKKNTPSDGWQRVQKIFHIDEFGELSDEMTIISQTAMLSSFVGLIYGGVMNSRTAYTDFMRQNTAASFTSHFEAKRKLQDAVTRSFAKGAFKWCWRVCLFSTAFVGISTIVSVYRGKNGISEYVIGGATTGALYKWQMGPKGWVSGAAVGSALGLFSGTLTYGLLQLSGYSMNDVRKQQAQMGAYRQELLKKAMANKEAEEDPLLLGLRKTEQANESTNKT